MYIIFCCVCRVHKTGYRLRAAAFTSTPTIDSAYRVTARAVCVLLIYHHQLACIRNKAKASLHFSHFFLLQFIIGRVVYVVYIYASCFDTATPREQLGLPILFLFLFYCTICGVVLSFFTRATSSSSFAMYRYIYICFFSCSFIFTCNCAVRVLWLAA